jgi:hypothetical protein
MVSCLLIKVEDAEIAIKPIPVGRYEIGQISINGATVSEIVISTNGFITKSSKSFIRMFNTGDIDKVAMGKSWLKFEQGMLSLKSIDIQITETFIFGKLIILKMELMQT